MYDRLHDAHRLIADVVSFKGPHINHLTPRTLDIDGVQRADAGIWHCAEGESSKVRRRRTCAILLRQTSFKALEEAGLFQGRRRRLADRNAYRPLRGDRKPWHRPDAEGPRALRHAALRIRASRSARPPTDRTQAHTRRRSSMLSRPFRTTGPTFATQGLGYFRYCADGKGPERSNGVNPTPASSTVWSRTASSASIPIVYEDFLPVSAAGIFQSNLGDEADAGVHAQAPTSSASSATSARPVLNEFDHYAGIEGAIDRRMPQLSACEHRRPSGRVNAGILRRLAVDWKFQQNRKGSLT